MIPISTELLLAVRTRLAEGDLSAEDRQFLLDCLDLLLNVQDQLTKKNATIAKLQTLLFGPRTEKKSGRERGEEASRRARKSTSAATSKAPRRRGRLSADDYPAAHARGVPHPTLEPGCPCPVCFRGKLYGLPPARQIHLSAESPFAATCYHLERLRCSACGAAFTAPEPACLAGGKYDPTAKTMVCLLKYGAGLPLNRMERLQSWLGVPLPTSTQFDLIESVVDAAMPVYRRLHALAAGAPMLYADDTGVRILSLMAENQRERPKRKGMYTTAIVAVSEGRKILLFHSGRRHAGENLAGLLEQRHKGLPPPIQMADALGHNFAHDHHVLAANCLTHGRRGFYALESTFPDEIGYILGKLATVYAVDTDARQQNLCPGARLLAHQRRSGPAMCMLKTYLSMLLEERVVEPNSPFGEAIGYMLRHWHRLTLFLRVPGAPIDNSESERAVKRHVLVRKNSLFYRNGFGALVGDVMLSLIHTCAEAGENPFDYLTALQMHRRLVAADPGAWLPWTFRATSAARETGDRVA